ncbi:MAG: hypothetical protein NVS9B10_14300 [Nevskia sp.]
MLRRLACVLALVPGFWLASAQALGLGEIDVRSKLNQRFLANIPVVSAGASESETLTLKLAGPDDFARAGIERSDYLSTLDFTFVPGSSVVRVTSKQSAHDPFLNFIVEARWNGGRLLREYTVLLDPLSDGATETPAPAPAAVARPVESPPPAKERPAPAARPAPAPKPAAAASSAAAAAKSGSYGPVQASETLWSIATKLRPNAGVNMDQMLLAIYQGNPQAFEGGINGLRKGSRLKVPSEADINAVDAATAKARVEQLRGVLKPEAATTAAAAKPTPPPAAVPAPAPVVAPPVSTPSPVPAAPAPAAAKIEPAPAPTPTTSVAPPAPAAAAPATATTPAPTPAAAAETSLPAPVVTTPTEAPAVSSTPATTAATETPEAAVAAKPAESAPAAPPASPDEGLLSEFQLPLLGALLLLLIAGFVLYRVRRSRAEQAAAYGAGAPVGVLRPMDEQQPGAGQDAPALSRASKAAAEPETASAAEKATPVVAAAAAAAAAATAADSLFPPPAGRASTQLGAIPDFDQTLHAEAQTVAVNLDASDPMTEADFHIAYGLYDEAAQMLKAAAEKDPDRVELRTKLAETYFAAGKQVEFQEVAEGLQNQVGRGEWERIYDMGRKLCPDARLFQDAGLSGAANPSVAPFAPSGEFGTTELSVIDFDLDTELAAATSPAAAPAATAPADDRLADIDLGSFDLGAETKADGDSAGHVDFNLEELDLGKFDEADHGVTIGDEIDTKLDLARAYADMGDNDAARGLLTEVINGGTDKQKAEAEALQQRLAG